MHLRFVPVLNGNASSISYISMFAVDIRKQKFLSNLNLLKFILMLS